MALMRFLIIFLIAMGLTSSGVTQDSAPSDAEEIIAEQQYRLDKFQASFDQSAAGDLSTLRRELNAERMALMELITTLELRLSTLQAEAVDALAAEDAAGTRAAETDPDLLDFSEILETQINSSERTIQQAQSLRRDIDALLSRVSEQDTRNQLQADVDQMRAEIEAHGGQIETASTEAELLELRESLRSLRIASEEKISPLLASRDRLAADLARLGEPPAGDAQPEAPEIVEERAKITRALVDEDAIIRQSALNASDISRLLNEISTKRRDRFYGQLLRRGPPPFSGAVLSSASSNAALGLEELGNRRTSWLAAKIQDGAHVSAQIWILLSLVFASILFFPTRRWIYGRVLNQLQSLEPTPARRVRAALVRMLARALPGVIGGFVVMEALRTQGVIDDTTGRLAQVIWFAIVGILASEATFSAIFSPSVPGWRLMPVEKRGAQLINASLLSLVIIFFLDRITTTGENTFGANQDLALLQAAIVAILMGVVYLILSRRDLWKLSDDRRDAFSDDAKAIGQNLRRTGRITAIVIIASALIGYVALAYFLATRIFLVGGLIVLGLFVRTVAQEALRIIDRAFARRRDASPPPEKEGVVLFWFGALLDLVIFLALLPLAAIALGADWVDVRDTLSSAFFGFKIGTFTFSLAQILGAIATFFIILSITRFFQRTAEKRFFPRTKMDAGVQNSLKTLIGYIGLVIGVLSSVSLLGFNLASLAFIAGALSLGIGFGLQTIVNNFVSGLILLFERPIKVGDWIVVASGEGTVKRISVRSTEIETFDRASLIVPNSELISGSVRNWTHKDRWTRMSIPVGVSYDADPRKVLKILQDIVADNRDIMKFPEPFVLFVGFGNSSLDFEIRVFISDTGRRLPIQNEIRLKIFEAFKDEGIEIPFPQQDVHVRTMTGGLVEWKEHETQEDKNKET